MIVSKINVLYAAIAQILTRGGFVFASMLLAGALGVSDFAAYSYFQLTVNMLSAYASLGVSMAAARSFAKSRLPNADAENELLALWILPVIPSVIIGTFLAFDPLRIIPDGTVIPNLYFIAAIVMVVLGSVPAGAINGLEAFRAALFAAVGTFTVLAGGTFVAARTSSLELAVAALLLAMAVKLTLETLIAISSVRRNGRRASLRGAVGELPRLAHFLGSSAIITLCSASAAWVVGKFVLTEAGEYEFSLYAIGLQWYGFALFIPGVISRVLFAQQVRLAHSSDSEAANRKKSLLKSGIKSNSMSSLLFFAIGAPLSPFLMRLYGDSYSGDYLVIIAFLAAGAGFSATNVIGNTLVAENRQTQKMYATIAWLVLLLALAYSGASYGATAMALAFLCSGLFLLALFSLLVFWRNPDKQKDVGGLC